MVAELERSRAAGLPRPHAGVGDANRGGGEARSRDRELSGSLVRGLIPALLGLGAQPQPGRRIVDQDHPHQTEEGAGREQAAPCQPAPAPTPTQAGHQAQRGQQGHHPGAGEGEGQGGQPGQQAQGQERLRPPPPRRQRPGQDEGQGQLQHHGGDGGVGEGGTEAQDVADAGGGAFERAQPGEDDRVLARLEQADHGHGHAGQGQGLGKQAPTRGRAGRRHDQVEERPPRQQRQPRAQAETDGFGAVLGCKAGRDDHQAEPEHDREGQPGGEARAAPGGQKRKQPQRRPDPHRQFDRGDLLQPGQDENRLDALEREHERQQHEGSEGETVEEGHGAGGQWSVVSGQSQVAGGKSQVAGRKWQVAGGRSQVAGRR